MAAPADDAALDAAWPSWAQIKVGREKVIASFAPCTCTRRSPPQFVYQESVRYGQGGSIQTIPQATRELIAKVTPQSSIKFN